MGVRAHAVFLGWVVGFCFIKRRAKHLLNYWLNNYIIESGLILGPMLRMSHDKLWLIQWSSTF